MSFINRYREDTSAPTFRRAIADLARRTLAPAVALWAVVVGIGLLIVGPLNSLPGEIVVNERLQSGRTSALNALTSAWSNIGATFFIIAACVVAMAVLWWRTRQWWLAVVPAIAISVQSMVFVTSAVVVGRGRPEVDHLDDSPPTSSFPSGHVGASTAFYVTLALLSCRIRNPVLRWAATSGCLLVPLLVAYARLYRGMHHTSDVAVGALNGLGCALLAWRYLRREAGRPSGSDPAEAGPGERVGAVGGKPDSSQCQQEGAEGQLGNGTQGAVQPLGLVRPAGRRRGHQKPAHQQQRDALGDVTHATGPDRPGARVLPQVAQEP